MNRNKLKRKWLIQGGLGACLFGFGLCCLIESGFLKHSGAIWYEWVIAGTISLSIVISGIVLLIKTGFLGEELKRRND